MLVVCCASCSATCPRGGSVVLTGLCNRVPQAAAEERLLRELSSPPSPATPPSSPSSVSPLTGREVPRSLPSSTSSSAATALQGSALGQWWGRTRAELRAKHEELFGDDARRRQEQQAQLQQRRQQHQSSQGTKSVAVGGADGAAADGHQSLSDAIVAGGGMSTLHRAFVGFRTMFLALPLFPLYMFASDAVALKRCVEGGCLSLGVVSE